MNDKNETVIVASFPKNIREAICVGINQYKGKNLIFIRSFAQALDGDGLVATKSGISLPIDKYQELFEGIKEVGNVMCSEKIVARIRKNSNQEIWIGLNSYKGVPLLYVRTYVKYGNEKEYKPTKKGISLRVELYPHLLEAAEKLGEAIAGL